MADRNDAGLSLTGNNGAPAMVVALLVDVPIPMQLEPNGFVGPNGPKGGGCCGGGGGG